MKQRNVITVLLSMLLYLAAPNSGRANMSAMYDPNIKLMLEEKTFEAVKIRLAGEAVTITVAGEKNTVEGEYYFQVNDTRKPLLQKYTLYMPQYVSRDLKNQPKYRQLLRKPVVTVDGQKMYLKAIPTPAHYAHIKQVPGLVTDWWAFEVTKQQILKSNPVTVSIRYEQNNFLENDKYASIYVPMIPQDANLSRYPDNFNISVKGDDGIYLVWYNDEGERVSFQDALKIIPEHLKPIITYVDVNLKDG